MADTIAVGAALVVRGPGEVVLERRSFGGPEAGQVLVRPGYVGICGTDREIVEGTLDPAYVRYPLVLGHEWSGRVIAVGEGVQAVTEGDPVVVEGIYPCGACIQCRAGRTNLCENYAELGFTLDGAAAPAVAAPATFVHQLAPTVPLDAGALVEPAAVVLRGLKAMHIEPGQRVLVVGDGTVALLAAHLVQMWSPLKVDMSGRRTEQKSLAATFGIDYFTIEAPEVRAYDLVIEAAGNTSAVETALSSVLRGGQVLLLGIAGHGNTADLYVDEVVNNDLTIRGSFSYSASAWRETVRLLNSGDFSPLPLITHRFSLDEYSEALTVLRNGDGGPRGKVLLELGIDGEKA